MQRSHVFAIGALALVVAIVVAGGMRFRAAVGPGSGAPYGATEGGSTAASTPSSVNEQKCTDEYFARGETCSNNNRTGMAACSRDYFACIDARMARGNAGGRDCSKEDDECQAGVRKRLEECNQQNEAAYEQCAGRKWGAPKPPPPPPDTNQCQHGRARKSPGDPINCADDWLAASAECRANSQAQSEACAKLPTAAERAACYKKGGDDLEACSKLAKACEAACQDTQGKEQSASAASRDASRSAQGASESASPTLGKSCGAPGTPNCSVNASCNTGESCSTKNYYKDEGCVCVQNARESQCLTDDTKRIGDCNDLYNADLQKCTPTNTYCYTKAKAMNDACRSHSQQCLNSCRAGQTCAPFDPGAVALPPPPPPPPSSLRPAPPQSSSARSQQNSSASRDPKRNMDECVKAMDECFTRNQTCAEKCLEPARKKCDQQYIRSQWIWHLCVRDGAKPCYDNTCRRSTEFCVTEAQRVHCPGFNSSWQGINPPKRR